MKTIYITLLTCTLFSINFSFCQIPNGGFEEWQINEQIENPVHWVTNNDSNYIRVLKDTSRVFGEYALKLVAPVSSAWQGCSSTASLGIKFDEPLDKDQSLFFYVKSIPDMLAEDPAGFLIVNVNFFIRDTSRMQVLWVTDIIITDFIECEIPLWESLDSISITIIGGAQNGAADNCINNSISWVDGLQIRKSTMTNSNILLDADENDVNIFPNPSKGKIYIEQNNSKFSNYILFDLQGRIVQQGVLNETLNINEKGLYILKLFKDNSDLYISKKVFVE